MKNFEGSITLVLSKSSQVYHSFCRVRKPVFDLRPLSYLEHCLSRYDKNFLMCIGDGRLGIAVTLIQDRYFRGFSFSQLFSCEYSTFQVKISST